MAEAAKDPRINVIIHKDFTKYDSAVLDQLKGARGCVWACKQIPKSCLREARRDLDSLVMSRPRLPEVD